MSGQHGDNTLFTRISERAAALRIRSGGEARIDDFFLVAPWRSAHHASERTQLRGITVRVSLVIYKRRIFDGAKVGHGRGFVGRHAGLKQVRYRYRGNDQNDWHHNEKLDQGKIREGVCIVSLDLFCIPRLAWC
jgi:hypothetical protein